jgi:DivIVA domain-containing protein
VHPRGWITITVVVVMAGAAIAVAGRRLAEHRTPAAACPAATTAAGGGASSAMSSATRCPATVGQAAQGWEGPTHGPSRLRLGPGLALRPTAGNVAASRRGRPMAVSGRVLTSSCAAVPRAAAAAAVEAARPAAGWTRPAHRPPIGVRPADRAWSAAARASAARPEDPAAGACRAAARTPSTPGAGGDVARVTTSAQYRGYRWPAAGDGLTRYPLGQYPARLRLPTVPGSRCSSGGPATCRRRLHRVVPGWEGRSPTGWESVDDEERQPGCTVPAVYSGSVEARFDIVVRGYDPRQVDELLDQAERALASDSWYVREGSA